MARPRCRRRCRRTPPHGGGVGAFFANRIAGPYLRLMFGVFVMLLGGYLIYGAARRLGWV